MQHPVRGIEKWHSGDRRRSRHIGHQRRGTLATRKQNSERTDRWAGRPVQAALIRIVAVAIPVAAGVLASVAFSHAIRYPHGFVAVLAWWVAVLAVSTLIVAVVDGQCRR